MSRVFDLIAVVAVAIVLLLPKPSLEAKPALVGEKIELDRIAELEDARYAEPKSIDHACDLADAYMRLRHFDWALATLEQFKDARDHRVHQLRATAYADRLEPELALAEIKRASEACDAEGATTCPDRERLHFDQIARPMQALIDQHIDPKKQQREAREAVGKELHSTKASDKH